MQIVTSIAGMRHACATLRAGDPRHLLSLVPTMGALHEGHRSLIRAARQACDVVAVSIFVNPLQFGPQEDYARYPQRREQDLAMLEQEDVDLLFAPDVAEMYPHGATTTVSVGSIGSRLDGASRPGHFSGVATVVSKLFHIVEPDRAYFGQKDAVQVAVLRALVRDLNFGVEISVCPTVRDSDGLALSSRNLYLGAEQRIAALALSQSLFAVQDAIAGGQADVQSLRILLLAGLERDGIRLDYAEIVDPDTLEPVETLGCGALVAVAAWVGSTRLIDNILVPPRGQRP